MFIYFHSWQSAAATQQAATQDSTDTIEHKEPVIIVSSLHDDVTCAWQGCKKTYAVICALGQGWLQHSKTAVVSTEGTWGGLTGITKVYNSNYTTGCAKKVSPYWSINKLY